MIRPSLKKYLTLPDEEILALALLGEVRGEAYIGKIAVGCVIRNRVLDKRWPNTYGEVILQSRQFSCFNQEAPFLQLIDKRETVIGWQECLKAARQVIGSNLDMTGGCDHYCRFDSFPYWRSQYLLFKSIGHHCFFKSKW